MREEVTLSNYRRTVDPSMTHQRPRKRTERLSDRDWVNSSQSMSAFKRNVLQNSIAFAAGLCREFLPCAIEGIGSLTHGLGRASSRNRWTTRHKCPRTAVAIWNDRSARVRGNDAPSVPGQCRKARALKRSGSDPVAAVTRGTRPSRPGISRDSVYQRRFQPGHRHAAWAGTPRLRSAIWCAMPCCRASATTALASSR